MDFAEYEKAAQRTSNTVTDKYKIINGCMGLAGEAGEVIDVLCGGLKPGRKLKAIIPGGSSAKVLRANERFKLKDGREIGIMDIPMDFDTMAACGSMAGSGGVIIMDDSRSMSWAINNLNTFYLFSNSKGFII